jgi:CheY-like chemotaxis protein
MVVEADRRQLEQVLLNIFINAWQAMPDGGELYLSTSNSSLTETDCSPHQIEPGPYVKISITDTGIGMDEKTRQRVFDPFFSTKTKGRGSGLGLASAYGIIRNHSGIITVDSEVGQGTTFNIYLPVSDQKPVKEVSIRESLIKGSETILLVDDEAIIIGIAKAMLEKLGYQVMVAESGQQALESVRQKADEIHLVILDLIMPGMDGGTTFDRIREIQPAMPVILASGYGMNEQVREIIKRGCNGFMQKPFDISKLSQNIRKILDEAHKNG